MSTTENTSFIEPSHTPLVMQFWSMVVDFPDRVAVDDSFGATTYRELAAKVHNISEKLHELGIEKGDLVAVQMSPSYRMMAVLLAIHSRGAGYIPLDKKSPAARNQLILDDSAPSILVGETEECLVSGVSYLDVTQWVDREISADIELCLSTCQAEPDSISYIIYTSGTTGVPKGVPITQKNMSALFAATAEQFAFCETDVVPLSHSFAFDISVWEIWSALGFGGTLLIPQESVRINPVKFAELIRSKGVKILNQTPTAFSVNSRKLMKYERDDLSLRAIVFGGERLNFYVLKDWIARFGTCSPALINMYGITEITVHATSYQITPADIGSAASRIGSCLQGFQWMIDPVSQGELPSGSGELLLAGIQVSGRYLNRPEFTAEKFVYKSHRGVQTLFYRTGDLVKQDVDGQLLYLGRADEQIKMHGYRIELSEIEMALSQCDEVDEVSIVKTSSNMMGDYLLCCYVGSGSVNDSTSEKLRKIALEKMPQYMRPLSYKELPDIPRTVNEKLTRKRFWQT